MGNHEPVKKDYVYSLIRAIAWIAKILVILVTVFCEWKQFGIVRSRYPSDLQYAIRIAMGATVPIMLIGMIAVLFLGFIPLRYKANKAGKDMTEYVMDKLPEEVLRHCFEKAGDRKYLEKYLEELGNKLGLTSEEKFLLYVHYVFFS